MALSRYNGMQNDMPNTFSSMLDRFFNESVNSRNFSGFTPHVDACETEKSFEIEISLPGVEKEDISIDFQEGKLTITGERKLEKKKMAAATICLKHSMDRLADPSICPIKLIQIRFRQSLRMVCCW
ncbi:hypothetical protein GCM10028895_39830 [Pontibacter rugosus]